MSIKTGAVECSPDMGNSGEQIDSGHKCLARDALTEFLSNVELGDTTLSLPQAEGFMFALACCPKQLDQEAWIEVILGDAYQLSHPSRDSAVEALVRQFLEIRTAVSDYSYRLPAEYAFSWDAVERESLEEWCEGMLLADEWLEPHWMHGLARLNRADPYAYGKLADELDDAVGLIRLLADIDSAIDVLETNPEDSLEGIRDQIKDSYDVIDKYLMKYMHAGKGLASYFIKKEPQVRSEPKVGRNDPCPCGSGKKFKKCCMKQ